MKDRDIELDKNPIGIPIVCNKCGFEHRQVFSSHKVITCPRCHQNPVGV